MSKTTSFQAPDLTQFEKQMRYLNQYFSPVFLNFDQIHMQRPVLLVGNHTLYGLLDVPFIVHAFRQQYAVHLRSLGDRAHFHVPFWHQLLSAGGMVEGTPENCAALMQQGESILVFPGGSREVMRRKDDGYALFWKQRTGFVRMALAHGYDILPFASVGPNECFDIHYDANDVLAQKKVQSIVKTLRLEKFIRGGDVFFPVSTGLFKLPIPRPERFYFSFGERIRTEHLSTTDDAIWQIRQQVQDAVEQQIQDLLRYRQHDQAQWSWLRRKLAKSSRT